MKIYKTFRNIFSNCENYNRKFSEIFQKIEILNKFAEIRKFIITDTLWQFTETGCSVWG